MEKVPASEGLKLIPTALKNLGLPEEKARLFHNYIVNLIILCVSDEEFRKKMNENLPKLIEELVRL